MGDVGFRPAFNIQYAVAGSKLGGPRTVVGVKVTNVGSDIGSLTPMVEQIQARTNELPKVLMADSGHVQHADIISARLLGVDVLVPPPEHAVPIERLRMDEKTNPELLAWRERMETAEAKEIYRARAGLCELNNAHQKSHHGIEQLLVRGISKVTCVALFHAVASNILQHARHLL
jgi:hypothetical protein